MPSLKQTIKYYLEKNGSMTLLELENLCKTEQYKLSNAERRLRELMKECPILPKKNPQGAIIGYIWQNSAPSKPISENVAKILASWQKPVEKPKLTLF